jgi:hypothetical protein
VLAPLSIGFFLGIIGSLAAAIAYDRATRPKLTVVPFSTRRERLAAAVEEVPVGELPVPAAEPVAPAAAKSRRLPVPWLIAGGR